VKDYHQVRILRDRLGFSEAQYDEEEQKYNGLEYEYTQKEGSFIDTMVSGIPPPPPSVDRYHHNRETEDLTKFADGPNGLGDSTTFHPLELPNDPLSLTAVENDRVSQTQHHEASREFDTSGIPHSQVSATKISYSLPQTPIAPNYLPRTRAASVLKKRKEHHKCLNIIDITVTTPVTSQFRLTKTEGIESGYMRPSQLY
jgi:hypothetical protein